MNDKIYIYFRESLIQSVLSDLFLFGMFAGAMWLNHNYLGDNGVWDGGELA